MATRGRKKAIAEPTPPACDPRDVETIERLQQRIQELEFQQLQQDSPVEETYTESNVWDDGSKDVNPFGEGNPLLTKETESEPIIWDIGDEEEECPFVNKYLSFKEEPIVLVEEESEDGKVDKELEIVEKMEKKELKLNVRTYNELISEYCKGDNVHKAMCKHDYVVNAYRLIGLMKENGVTPNEWTYSSIIEAIYGYFQKGKADSGTNLFLQMLITGCLPSSWTYNVVINGFCKDDKMQEVLYLIRKIIKIGFEQGINTYTILIEGLLKSSDFDDARKLFIPMVSLGLKPDVCTYTSFILAHCSQGMVTEAEDIMIEMIKEGVEPDTGIYTVFIYTYVRFFQEFEGDLSLEHEKLIKMFEAAEKKSNELEILMAAKVEEPKSIIIELQTNNTDLQEKFMIEEAEKLVAVEKLITEKDARLSAERSQASLFEDLEKALKEGLSANQKIISLNDMYTRDPLVNMCLNFLHGSDSEQRTHELMHIYLASASVCVWIG
nr:pentatricopeptide repeat-containing protein At5g65560 [Tanacetum cinerariifolium]